MPNEASFYIFPIFRLHYGIMVYVRGLRGTQGKLFVCFCKWEARALLAAVGPTLSEPGTTQTTITAPSPPSPLTNNMNMNTKIKTSSKCTMTLQTPQTRNAMRCVHFGHRNGTTLLNCYDFIQLLQSIRGINLFTVLFYGCQSSFFRFTFKCVRFIFRQNAVSYGSSSSSSVTA